MEGIEYFQKIFRHSNDAIFVIDLQNNAIIEVNDSACKMLGYSHKELMSSTIDDIHPDEIPELMKFSNKVYQLGQGWTNELTFLTKRGKKIPAEISASIFKTNYGKYVIAMVRDISERKAIEQQLRDSEEKYRDIFESAYDVIFMLDSKGNILDINYMGEQVTGYDRNQLCTMNVLKHFIISEDQDIIKQVLADVAKGKKRFYEVSWRNKKGEVIHFEGTTTARFGSNGKFISTRCILRDITLRKRRENELKQSDKKYRTLVETLNEGLVMVDNDDVIQYVNKAFCEMIGHTEKEMVGKRANAMNWIDEDGQKLIQKKLRDRQNGISGAYELSYRNKAGEKLWALVSGAPFYDENGETAGSFAVNMDITQLKQAELLLRQKNKELNTLIYKLSHDLAAPLSSILGVMNLAEKDVHNEVTRNYLRMIKNSTKILRRILVGFFEISKISQATVRTSLIDFDKTIEEVFKSLKNDLLANGLDLSINIKQKKQFYSDKTLLHLIIQNLTDNALKYKKTDQQHPSGSISVKDADHGVEIKMQDNGIGIPNEIHDKIFDMFFKGSESSRGSGLGLYIVKCAVEKLDGKIAVESKKKTGTTFTCYLPSLAKSN